MVSPIRPYKCSLMSVVKQGGKRRCLDRQVSKKVNFLLICVSEKCHFSVRMFGRYVSVKSGSNKYLGDDGAKELVIIYDHVHFSCKNKWTKDCFLSPKGAGPWRNPCDTDTGNERSVRVLASCEPSLV